MKITGSYLKAYVKLSLLYELRERDANRIMNLNICIFSVRGSSNKE